MNAEWLALRRNAILSVLKRFPAGANGRMVRMALGSAGFDDPIEEIWNELLALKTLGLVQTRESGATSSLLLWSLTAEGLKHCERENL